MALTYTDYFILTLFSTEQPKKGSTVFHILQGKKTASILYRAADYSLDCFFGFFPTIVRHTFFQRLDQLVSVGYVTFNSDIDEYQQTVEGKEAAERYFSHHYYPTKVRWMTHGRAVQEFQKKVYFLTQIFSEIRHKNSRYIPLEKNGAIQQWAKQWLKQQRSDVQESAVKFGQEWKLLLSQLESENAIVVTQSMSGHQIVGLTKKQLAERMSVEALEISMREADTFSRLVELTVKQQMEVPLFYSILKEIMEQNDNSLSKSAKETIQLIQKGYSLEQVTNLRNLKKSTVSEHLIEWVILFPKVDIKPFIPKEIYQIAEDLMNENPAYTFKDMQEKVPAMEFLWFRLMQIERRRKNG